MKIFKALFFSFSLLLTPLLFKKEFKLPPIYDRFPSKTKWEMPPPSRDVLAILNQPFTYFAKGNQSTVFLSEDGDYVLKLFRYKRSLFHLVHSIKNIHKTKKRQTFLAKMEKTFDAAHLACNEGREFTGCVYCHINVSQKTLPSPLFKVGKKSYQLSLDRYRFVLQRKAHLLTEALLKSKSEPEKTKEIILSFFHLLLQREKKNIRNSDPNLGTNFGFLDGKAVEIDFGNYQKSSFCQQQERDQFLLRLSHWAEKNMPEHVSFIRDLQGKS